MKRRLAGLFLVIVMSFGFAPSALAHNGSHDVWEACRLLGGTLTFITVTLIAKKAPIQVGSGLSAAGNAGGFYHKYGSHGVRHMVKSQNELIKANSGAPNMLYGAMR